jgi:hypothetical protein
MIFIAMVRYGLERWALAVDDTGCFVIDDERMLYHEGLEPPHYPVPALRVDYLLAAMTLSHPN